MPDDSVNSDGIGLEDVQKMAAREFRIYSFLEFQRIKEDTKEIKNLQRWVIGLVVVILLALLGNVVMGF